VSLLLCLDPGESTGWATFTYDAVTPLRKIEHGIIVGGLRGFISWWRRTGSRELWDHIVAEDFILDGRTARPNTTPLEILGALEYIAETEALLLVRQRNFMKAHAPDELLKEKGLWIPGPGHDRDAIRHGIAFAKTNRHMPTLRWLTGREAA
jgi:hypothetical protein